MEKLNSALSSVKVLDGGFGEEAAKRSHHHISHQPLWSSQLLTSDPTLVESIHIEFIKAGADIVESNTYQPNVDTLIEHAGQPGSVGPSEAAEILASGVRLARRAAERCGAPEVLVAGSCGPYGAAKGDLSEYTGAYALHMSEEELANWHRPRIAALASAQPDLLAFETVPCAKEARAMARALREFPNVKAWVSFVTLDGALACNGDPLLECLAPFEGNSQIVGLGVNCLIGPELVTRALQLMRGAPKDWVARDKCIVVYPNSGERYSTDKVLTFGSGQKVPFDRMVPQWLELGARWIGGCCRVGPEDIGKVAEVVSKFRTGQDEKGH